MQVELVSDFPSTSRGTSDDPIESDHEDTPMGDATQAKSSPVAHVRNGAITKGKKPARPYSWDA